MINLYEIAEKVILVNPFRPPHKMLSYTALFSHTMTLKGSRGVRFKLRQMFKDLLEFITFGMEVIAAFLGKACRSNLKDLGHFLWQSAHWKTVF